MERVPRAIRSGTLDIRNGQRVPCSCENTSDYCVSMLHILNPAGGIFDMHQCYIYATSPLHVAHGTTSRDLEHQFM